MQVQDKEHNSEHGGMTEEEEHLVRRCARKTS
jgi:hypothetical protein